ncbi:cobalamin biosynthesis protein [Vibrio sp. DW001]|uniref:cobalamin biosynthesis protein n=1 Tax=Vibrio sp. DW001 TaxID=2912315 RepID=UPI0023AFAC5A|nr:cobalamin biosynthesis protein [Vibrio sp. DW001]WED28717.1 cobalamin biosynthesis protein [Vibrio sp. DW001]
MMKLAIYAITVNGAKQGKRLSTSLPFADLYVSDAAKLELTGSQRLTLPLSKFVAEKFGHYDGHIFICATGIVTRMISPLIKDKTEDPAVVCMDEQANFAISMLSGHRGGANDLTERVAHIVKATPVITTASDVSESVSVDMLGAPFGWHLDTVSESAITPISAAVVNDEPVIIVQETGEKNWWKYDKRMPPNILCSHQLNGIDSTKYRGAILISDRLKGSDNTERNEGQERLKNEWQNKLVLWRPKSLILGFGCDRNTPLSTLKAGIQAFSERFSLSLDSVHAIASIDLKADEVGLLELSEHKQWPFVTFAAEQLDDIVGIENPSDYVKKVTGSNSVAEAAALKLSNTNQLVVAKWVFKQDGFNMTIACCRREFSESLVQQKRKNWHGQMKHGGEGRHGDENLQTIKVKVNTYGNEVAEGFECKTKHVDLDRAMLFHRHHLLLCEGKRCAKAGSKNLAHDLRGLIKKMGLSSGDRRIKISRTMCVGACRNRSTLAIYERPLKDTNSETPLVNNAQWLRNVEDFSESQWHELFTALADNRPVTQVVEQKYLAALESPAKETHCG